METNRSLARAGYLLASLLVVLPLFDATMQAWPLHVSDERWRFQTLGAVSNLLLVPLLGLLLAATIASLAGDRRVKRVVGSICGILALVMVAFSVLFVMDYFQVRTAPPPKFQHILAVATAAAVVKNVLSIIALLLLSRVGFGGSTARGNPMAGSSKKPPSPITAVGGTRSGSL